MVWLGALDTLAANVACRFPAPSRTLFGMESSTIAGTPAQAGESTGVPPTETSAAVSISKPTNKRLL